MLLLIFCPHIQSNDALSMFYKMTTTQYGKQTIPKPNIINTSTSTNIIWTIQAIVSSNSCVAVNNNNINNKHVNTDEDVLSKSKCKICFSRHLMQILIVILISFTFADVVHGKLFLIFSIFF